MKNTVGVIYKNENEINSWYQPIYGLPVYATYKLIEFPVSSMLNSGIKNIAVLTDNTDLFLSSNLHGGFARNLELNDFCLSIIPSYNNYSADIFNYIKMCREKYVLFCRGDMVFNMDFSDLLNSHINNRADITVLTTKNSFKSAGICLLSRYLFLNLAENKIFNKIDDIASDAKKQINTLKIFWYNYSKYMSYPMSAEEYYKMSEEFLLKKTDSFLKDNRIFTQSSGYPPTVINKNADIKHAIIGDGCIINGKVYGSVISCGVRIQKGASVLNSVIMDKCFLGNGCTVKNAVLKDKCIIKENVEISGEFNRPALIESGDIITKNKIFKY
ncbi:MAG: hypothetical protein J5590_04745 [Clostridia bacterium]|nr:hypothetical protein [Clostridia bacterium]